MDGNEFQESRFEKPEEMSIASTEKKGDANPFIPKFEEFFSTIEYKKKIEKLAHEYPQQRSLIVDFNELDSFDYQLAEELLEHPDLLLEAARLAVQKIEVSVLQLETFKPNVRFRNLPKDRQPLVRDISAAQLGKLISVEGVIRQVTEVMPKLKNAQWRCKRCANTYRLEQDGHQQRKPALCSCKHRDFELVSEESVFVDYQKIQIQEPLEMLKGSEQAVNLDVYIEDDFVNKVYPGNRTQITGMLRLYPPNKDKKNVYGRYLEAVHVEETEKEFEDVTIVEEDEAKIKELSQNPKIYDILVQSIAPSIFGHEIVKESISLQLFGGVRKNLPGETKIRGNVHILLVGDPGTGKCVAGDTIVPLSNGELVPISTIVNQMLNHNQHVMSDGTYALMQQKIELPILNQDVKQITSTATVAFKRKPEKMFNIITQMGKTLKCTHTHPIFTARNTKVKAVRTEELNVGDYIATPRKLEIHGKAQALIPVSKGKTNAIHITFPEKTSLEFGQFVGLQLAEGCTDNQNGSAHLRFTNSDSENLDLFEQLSQKLFNLTPYKQNQGNAKAYGLSSIELYRFIQTNAPEMLHHSQERTIPKIIQKSDLNTIRGFLQTFIESEGHVQGRRKSGKHQSTIEISSASQTIIRELSYLLLRFGVVSRITETQKMATNGARILRPYWRLTIGGAFAQRYIQEIGFITERKKNTSKELFNIKSNTNIDIVPNIRPELKRIRQTLQLSQFEMGISRTTYQHYEREDRNPTRGNLYLIAQEFMNQYTRLNFEEVQLQHDIINLMKLAISDIFWDKIKSINEIPCEEYVYDVEVEGTHNFVSNGIYSHNSVLLQATDKIAPKSVYVSGKGSSSAGLCVAPDSLILNDNGFKSIEEFVETKFDDHLKCEELPGAFSNEFSGQTHALTEQLDFAIQPIEKIWRINAPPKMIQFTTRTGRELGLTPATSLIRLKNSKAEWIEASELQNGDYVAVPRFLPEGKRKNVPTFTALLDDPYIKIGNPLAEWMKEIIEKLVPKYGSKQAIAKKVGKGRDTIYAIQNPKFHHGWELQKVVELAREAGYSDDQIAQKITTLFIRHGITNRIPPYLDDPDVAYLAGAIMGDGSMEGRDDRTTIRLCGNDSQILERCTEILHEKFGITPEKEKSEERIPSLRMSSRILGKILYAYGMRHEKKENALSHAATEMPNHVLRNVLQGLFDTDGYANDSKTGGKNVGISSISPSLAQTIHLSLLKFGIISKKRFRKRAGNVAVGKKITVISRNDQYCIEIYGKRNLQQFREKIGFGLTRKQETLEKIIQSIHYEKTNIDFVPEIKEALQKTKADSQYKKGKARTSHTKLKELMKNEDDGFLQKLSNANILWDQIKIKKGFKPTYEYVYDMTVSGSHNFIANGFYVHNTASAVKDDFGEGGWTLKAGALVLASGGMVMVDEFDKMECLMGDSLVCTENGELKPIREIFEEVKKEGKIDHTKSGISVRDVQNRFVLSMDDNLKIVKRRVLAAHEYPHSGRVLEIRLQSGEKIKTTPNHPFFTTSEKEVKTIKAGYLKKGDFVLVPASLPNDKATAPNEKLSRLYGYLAGDGNVTYNPPENYLIRFTNKDADLLGDFSSCCESIFDKPTVYPSAVRAGGLICTRVNGEEHVDFIAKHAPGLMEKFDNKYSPPIAFHSPENTSNYLRGLFDSEGSVDTVHQQVSFASTSERLIMEVKALLLKHGIISQIQNKKSKEKRRAAYILRITDADSLTAFSQKIGFTSTRKRNKLHQFIQPNRERSVINIIPNIGDLLNEIRLELGLLQKQCGINKITYNNFENGIANISVKKAQKVLEIFKARTLKTNISKETKEKIRYFETLVNGDVRWRKVSEIKEVTIQAKSRLSYQRTHQLNQILRDIGIKKITQKQMMKKIPVLIENLKKKQKMAQENLNKDISSWNKIKNEMDYNRISQTKVAKESGVSQSTLTRWMNLKTTPPKNALANTHEIIKRKLAERKQKIEQLLHVLHETIAEPTTTIYDLTVEGGHNFIANNIVVHNSEDRSAMHEAMEQGQVSIAKAGIVTRFKTDTSVLAAANPKLSRFDTFKPFFEQIDLPSSLISRFDLFFMIRDTLDKTRDTTIASHILATHKAGEQLLQYQRGNKQINLQEIEEIRKKVSPLIDIALLRKYISFARQRVFPILSQGAAQAIQDFYVGLRDQGRQQGSYSATARQLEGLVRLAEASARVRLSDEVTIEDAERAIRLVRTSLEDVVRDPETGRIDIDIVTSGQTQSSRDHMRVITEIVKSKSKEMDRVPIQDVVAEAISRGIDEEKVREIIIKLKKAGELYEPNHGFLKSA